MAFENKTLLFLLVLIIAASCNRAYTPKPHGYFRIDFPEKKYINYESDYPYFFKYPAYSRIIDYKKDSAWINIYYPDNNAVIYLTYKEVNNNINDYLEETRRFVYKHTLKADAISETPFINYEESVYGILYDIKGNAASSINFFVTDSTQHFMRGALYFNTKPNKDSLAPVVDFIRTDIVYLMESFEWK